MIDIRDNHTEDVALHELLEVTVPQVPIIFAHSYLQKMGSRLTTEATGESQLTRSPTFIRDALLVAC